MFNPANAAVVPGAVNCAYTTAAYGPPRTFGIVFDASF
jgi:hypothetical protein